MWVELFITIAEILLLLLLFPLGYLLLLALGAIRSASTPDAHSRSSSTRFMIVIPAHNEAGVIRATVSRLLATDYPAHLFSIHIIADHCSDNTPEAARHAGAVVHERNEGPRTGKGAALSWAMFLIDNRFQNLGRSNLGWSAKNMGDSICFRVDILRKLGWGEGLTEDYHLRHKLLLNDIRIAYEPAAIGYGEAPLPWDRARAQRARWLRGTHDTSQQYVKHLI